MTEPHPTLGEMFDVLSRVSDWLDGHGYDVEAACEFSGCDHLECAVIRLRDRLEQQIKPKGESDANG